MSNLQVGDRVRVMNDHCRFFGRYGFVKRPIGGWVDSVGVVIDGVFGLLTFYTDELEQINDA